MARSNMSWSWMNPRKYLMWRNMLSSGNGRQNLIKAKKDQLINLSNGWLGLGTLVMVCLLDNVYRPFFQSSGAFYILNVHFDFVDHVFRDGISSLSLLSLVGFQVKRYTCYMKKKHTE